MRILTKKSEISALCQEWKSQNLQVALVPTMGYYHAGHESLMRFARSRADKVVVSLFVNPTQFGPNEDLSSYPRNLAGDAAIAKNNGVDVIFAPEADEMYPNGNGTIISVPTLSNKLCGISRPTHFNGVCTIVLKLFSIIKPNLAIFGQKDWQQLAIIRQMVRDLDLDVDIIGQEIVRDHDGLALSSRNTYLTEAERAMAPYIYKGLCQAKKEATLGANVGQALEKLNKYWEEHLPLGKVDYANIVDASTLEPHETLNTKSLLVCAVHLGKARLIDNILLFN